MRKAAQCIEKSDMRLQGPYALCMTGGSLHTDTVIICKYLLLGGTN
jgi:hypothetical protein